ncbi:hypothetical protein F441_14396 [Phytophthora nicotianae CJ01A1]|uniref:Uncharacterized protein n=2 Tax=Phytophthora nicotianae TaxID=4792 RepID=W2GCU0_PHYNI|nr:hypothetical protein L915_14166 [Phytophthora nicotianae]ETL33482.1 hypothetical protein L916_14064 [Phytophthora nicotianae]ETP09802.1 hypothetical protein F441_14396 [Phytophthora nicotianae CJ01A1]
MGSEIENLLQELRDAYATIDSLQRQLHLAIYSAQTKKKATTATTNRSLT